MLENLDSTFVVNVEAMRKTWLKLASCATKELGADFYLQVHSRILY